MIEKANKDTLSDNVIDLNINGIGKKRIRINGDDSKIIELNTSDSNILKRFTEGYSEFLEWKDKYITEMSTVEEKTDINSIEYWQQIVATLKPIDEKMREIMNYIFNADISSVCNDGGAMYDILDNGKLRFETILEELLALYGDNIARNFEKMSARANELAKDYIIKSD